MNLSLNVQNAFVITDYTGSDPEPALFDLLDGNPLAPGIDRRNSYYSARSFTPVSYTHLTLPPILLV